MQTYDPKLFTISVGGQTISELADGTFIKAGFNTDAFAIKVGADGKGCRVRNADESGRFEITVLSASPGNDTLAALSLLDRRLGTGIVPVFVKDGSGTAQASAAAAWVVKQPEMERGKEMTDTTWILETLNLQQTQGGTTDV